MLHNATVLTYATDRVPGPGFALVVEFRIPALLVHAVAVVARGPVWEHLDELAESFMRPENQPFLSTLCEVLHEDGPDAAREFVMYQLHVADVVHEVDP